MESKIKNKEDARNKAVDYLFSAAYDSYNFLSKIPIDDFGTLSEDGYTDEDCDKIKKELDFLIKKILKYKTN